MGSDKVDFEEASWEWLPSVPVSVMKLLIATKGSLILYELCMEPKKVLIHVVNYLGNREVEHSVKPSWLLPLGKNLDGENSFITGRPQRLQWVQN